MSNGSVTPKGGMWKRQSSVVSTEASLDETGSSAGECAPLQPSSNNLQVKSGDSNSPSIGSPPSGDYREAWQVLCQIFLTMLVSFLASVVVPLARSTVDESIRSRDIPYQSTKAGDLILDFDLNHPLVHPPTVSAEMLVVTCVLVPFVILLIMNAYQWKTSSGVKAGRDQSHQVRASICGLFTATAISEGSTNILKLYVSRKRPNFYALCAFDETTLQCMAPLKKVREASLSFPSGHSSLSWCGMTFLALYLLGRVATIPNATTRSNFSLLSRLKPCLAALSCLFPWSYSTFVATSRIVDWWHHPSDVVAGSLVGIASAVLSYHHYYPNVRSIKAGLPLSLQTSSIVADD